MSTFIENPISNPNWNPQEGDYFSHRVYEEDLLYAKRQFSKKVLIGGLLSIHMVLFTLVVVYFS